MHGNSYFADRIPCINIQLQVSNILSDNFDFQRQYQEQKTTTYDVEMCPNYIMHIAHVLSIIESSNAAIIGCLFAL